MGTSWSAVVPDALAEEEQAALLASLEAELRRIDGLMSTWNPDSELSRFNRRDDTAPVALDADTLSLVDAAREISRETDGAYDVTLGPLIDLWGFGPTSADRDSIEAAPDPAAIERALGAVGDAALERAPGTLAKGRADVELDLSSIAKGFAVDRLGLTLADAGHAAYLVEIGGEVRTRGTRADGEPWRVGIERPDGPADEGLALVDAHVASSGSYRNVRRIDGQVVSHLLDGRTGRPVAHALVAVTVLHPESTALADAWATALLVVGPEAARRQADERPLAVQLVTAGADGKLDTWRSPTFAELVPATGR